jgi:hypothetical protein
MTKTSWRAWTPPIVLAALGLGFALVPLAQGRMFFYWDNAQQHFAQTVFLQQGLQQGAIPHWWPNVGLGFPATAEGQAAHYHPVRFLSALLFSAPAALMWEVALYLAIAGLSTYFFLRQLRLHRTACMLGAATQMFCSFSVIYIRNVALHRSFCLLPLAMLCAERFVQRRDLRSWLAAGLVIGIQFLAGHPSFAIVTAVATAVYVCIRVLQESRRRRASAWQTARALAARLGAWAGVAVLSLGLAAIQVLPTLRHAEQSQRQGGLSFEFATGSQPATVRGMAQLLFPYAYTQGDWMPEAAWWGRFNPVPSEGIYNGAMCVVLAPLALWWRRRWSDVAMAMAASAWIAVGFALGAKAPLFPLLWSLPGMNGLRFPSRFLLWGAFCLSALTAIGAHRLLAVSRLRMGTLRRLAPLILVAGAVIALAGAIALRIPSARGGVMISLAWFAAALLLAAVLATAKGPLRLGVLILAVGLAIGDLWYFRARGGYVPAVPIEQALSKPDHVTLLKQDPESFRVLSLIETENGAFTTPDLREYVQADLCTIWDVDSADVFLSLFLKRYYAVRSSIVQEILQRPEASRSLASFLGALNVKYIVAPIGVSLGGWEHVATGSATTVWKNPAARPRAFLVGQVVPQTFALNEVWRLRSDERLAGYRRTVSDWQSRAVDAQILDHVMARQLDYGVVAEVADSEAVNVASADAAGTVRSIASGPDRMQFSVTTAGPALLVIANSWYPGWTATVNGQPARLFETNWVMTGVTVPAGASDVVLRYTTPGYRTGLVISAVVLVVVAGLMLRPSILRRRRPLSRG